MTPPNTFTTTEAAHGIGLTVPQFQLIARGLGIKPAEGGVSKKQGGGYRWTDAQIRAIRASPIYSKRVAKRELAEARLSKETPGSDILMRRLGDALPKHGATLTGGTTTLVVANSWVEDAINWLAADARRRNDSGLDLESGEGDGDAS